MRSAATSPSRFHRPLYSIQRFGAGALFFVLVPGDPKSGALYVFGRRNGVFYSVDFNDQNWGGYSLAEYEVLERTHRISRFAQRPWLLNRRSERGKTN